MKKHCTAVLIALCAAASLAAQTDTSALLLNVGNYSKFFLNAHGRMAPKYTRVASDDDYNKIAALGGEYLDGVDTPLEIALLSTCAGVVDVRPVEASTILGNARQADLKLGAAVYQEMQMLRFLGNTDAVGRHEGILKFITDRGDVSRSEIESYLKQGINSLVDETFSNVYVATRDYHVNIIYNLETKSYKVTYTKNRDTTPKEITAKDLPELERKLTASGAFRTDDISLIINDKALKIPSYVYSDWVEKGLAQANGVTLIREAVTNFFVAPTKASYDVLVGIYANYWLNGGLIMGSFEHEARVDFDFVLGSLSPDISKQIYRAVDGRQVNR
jgi:hypothetical protein